MRQGCISLGKIHCDDCHHIIPYSERYLAIDEEDGIEVEKGKTARYCVKCALQKNYAYYKIEKGNKRILTFFNFKPNISPDGLAALKNENLSVRVENE